MDEITPLPSPLDQEKKKCSKFLVRKVASFEKALTKAQASLKESEAFEEAKHLADLVKAHYGDLKKGKKEIEVIDWNNDNKKRIIPIDPTLSPKDVLHTFFKKSRKLERAIEPLKKHIDALITEVMRYKGALDTVSTITTLQELHTFQKSYGIIDQHTVRHKKMPVLPYHLYLSKNGVEILVGKSSNSNHILTFQVAKGLDLWLHAHAVSGAHVVVRKKKDHDVDSETLQDALQLALFYSKAKNQPKMMHEVLVTERKYVSRTPSAPKGKVLVSKHKIMAVLFDPDYCKTLVRHSSR
jgi:predicted ribosome quality control (RQC) complex YloA/Tae2 family protein